MAAADVLPVVLRDFACELDRFHDLTHAKEPKKAWNSDDEDVDEFGRKKKRGARLGVIEMSFVELPRTYHETIVIIVQPLRSPFCWYARTFFSDS